ncbi:MAG TPA: hypothetical protein VFO05_03680, partial [Candidatus Limnocylindrales bacterium]|nr:hypothetical protein [Candidatus Limnocylindrales bacterium]
QAQPDEVRPRRSTDRERAAKLRVLGSELQESGATSVLLIPPVPSVLGQGLIGIVSKRLATRSLRARLRRPTRIFPRPERGDPEYALWELLETGREVRREIIAWAAENLDEDLAEAALELALDVTVFTRASARELAMDGSSIQSR